MPTNLKIFVLEDDEARQNWFLKRFFGKARVEFAATAEAGVLLLRSERYDAIFLDHDLTPEHSAGMWDDDTGYVVAQFLAANPQRGAAVVVHSMNPSGSQRMVDALRSAGIGARLIPFPQLQRSSIGFG
jgi:hypothetical protein